MHLRHLLLAALLLPLAAGAVEPPDSLPASTVGVYAANNPNTLTEREMNRDQVTNPMEAISGRVAGLTVSKSSNGLAAMNAVRVRGTTSLTGGNDPLFIIDGVLGDLATLSSISPTDIESFSILKDAGETAMYGSRGASGVIVVRTKKSSAKGSTVSYSGSVGFTSAYKRLNMLSADDYRHEVTRRSLMLVDHGFNTDWDREITRTGFLTDHHVAFTGGGDKSGYRISLGYVQHNGIIMHDKMRNFTANMNMHHNLFDGRLIADIGMFGNTLKEQTAIFDVQKTFYSAAAYNPTFSATRNADGTYDSFTLANQITHPMALMDSRTRNNTNHLSTHCRLTADLGRGWQLTAFGSYSYNEVETSHFYPPAIWAHGEAYKSTRKTEQLIANAAATWDHHFRNGHHLTTSASTELQRDVFSGFYTTTSGFNNNISGLDAIQGGSLRPWNGTGSYRETPTMAAFMGRIAAEFCDNRYALTATARADGSSKFGQHHKWGFFPSVSATWNIGRENFLKNITWLDELKLRAGYGLAGNQGGIDAYMSLATLQPLAITPVGSLPAVSLAALRNANPDLKWEVKHTTNVGIDFGAFGSRLILGLDAYYSKTTDMLYLYNVGVPPFAYNKLLANLGSMRNSGLEIALGITAVERNDFGLYVNANVAYQSNKLLSLSGSLQGYNLEAPTHVDIASLNGAGFHGGDNHIVYQVIGQPLGVFYLPHCTGLIEDGSGGYSYDIEDINGDGRKDPATDRRVCGQAVPKVLLGSNISLRYRNCDLALQINGAFGHKIYNGSALSYMNMNNLPGYNVLAEAPARNIKDQTATDYWLENGNYVNFDYLTIGWNVPLHTKYVSSLRLSATVSNLATITSYSGLTPMINSSTVGPTLGVDDKNTYPVSRTYSLAVNILF